MKPSSYRLEDGTLLQAIINVSHLVQDPKSPYGYGISSLSAVALYVPRENRHPERYAPFESSSIPSNMLDDDIGYETLVEDFNAYSMSNGMTLSVKSVVGQVGKTKFYTVQGEPLYTVHTVPVIKITSGA